MFFFFSYLYFVHVDIRVVYFKSHHCNSPYGASGRCTSALFTCYLTDMEQFNIHHWSNECEQIRENVWCNVNGLKVCKKIIIPSFVSIWWKILINILKQSWKSPESTCLIKTSKIAKKILPFWEYLASNLW